MKTVLKTTLACTALLFGAATAPVHAAALPSALVYVPLTDSCRLVDTRVAGSVGLLTQANGNYLFGARDASVQQAYQSGNAAGCGIPDAAIAISVYFNATNASKSGNLFMWTSASATRPTGGAGVYNPSVVGAPMAGQVLYNPGQASVQINPADGTFFLAVSNGQLDLTINASGYWLPLTSYLASSSAVSQIANSSALAPTTLAGGVVGSASVMSVSGSTIGNVPNVSVAGNSISLSSVLPATQVFPQATTFSHVHGAFYTTASLTLVGGSLTPKAELYVAPAGSLTAVATGLTCTGSAFTGVVSLGTVSQCTAAGSASVNAGDVGVWVVSTSASGLSLATTFLSGAMMSLSQ